MNEIPDPPSGAGKERFRFVAAGRVLLRRTAAAGLVRFAGWWSLFAGALALNSVCPVCGNAGCPTGIGSFGLVAAVLAFVKQYGGGVFRRLRAVVRAGKDPVSAETTGAGHGAGRCNRTDSIPDERCINERKE